MRRVAICLAAFAVTLPVDLPESRMTRHDQHSFAEPAEARVTHVAIDLTADFEAHDFSGTATLTVEAVPDAKEVVLDTRTLTIEGASDRSGEPLAFHLDAADPSLAAHCMSPSGRSADRREIPALLAAVAMAASVSDPAASIPTSSQGRRSSRARDRRRMSRRPPEHDAHRRARSAVCGDERRAAHA